MLKLTVFSFLCAPLVIQCQSPMFAGGQPDPSQMSMQQRDPEEQAINDIETVNGFCYNLMENINQALSIASSQQIYIPEVELMLFQSAFHACGVHRDIYDYYNAGITMGAGNSADPLMQQQQQQQAPTMMSNN